MSINKPKFYKEYREVFGSIKKDATVESIDDILNVFDSNKESVRGLEKQAYMLATVRHEVGPEMLPIVENLNYTSGKRIMQVWPSRFPTLESTKDYVGDARMLGNKVYGGRMGNGLLEGYKYRGRGIGCQLTGYENYKKFGKMFDVDLVGNPDLALDTKLGAKILYVGMTKGRFTGKKLSDYLNENEVDYVNARSVVNPDVERNGEKIAEDAKKFYMILKKSVL